jgi:hypothetical protein
MISSSFHHTLPSSLGVGQDNSPLPFFATTATKLVKRHTLRPPGKHINWNAREHRKQRYLAASPRTGQRRFNESPWARIARMGHMEYWNVSWWVAVVSYPAAHCRGSHHRRSKALYHWLHSLGYQWLSSLPALCHLPPCVTRGQRMVSLGRRDHLRLWIRPFDPRSLEQGRRGMLWFRRQPSLAVPPPQANQRRGDKRQRIIR